jgi:dimeric dUTPase (all-alpha-NTP-PPase superfamily)
LGFLRLVFNKQIALNKKIGFDLLKIREDQFEREKFTKEYVLAMHCELTEFSDWTNFKIWRKTRHVYDDQRLKELRIELIDLLHFLINLMILWEMTPEMLEEIFLEKNAENHNRQERGY